jgi:MoxR-like ATPase
MGFSSNLNSNLELLEIDKSDIDLPNDLLTIFEEGRFEIPELARLEKDDEPNAAKSDPLKVKVRTAYTDEADRKVSVLVGRIICQAFPLVILKSNGERDFPPPFLRRCLRLNMRDPNIDQLQHIVQAHLQECDLTEPQIKDLIEDFLQRRDQGKKQLATNQLLNALFMIVREREWMGNEKQDLIDRLVAPLDRPLGRSGNREK